MKVSVPPTASFKLSPSSTAAPAGDCPWRLCSLTMLPEVIYTESDNLNSKTPEMLPTAAISVFLV